MLIKDELMKLAEKGEQLTIGELIQILELLPKSMTVATANELFELAQKLA